MSSESFTQSAKRYWDWIHVVLFCRHFAQVDSFSDPLFAYLHIMPLLKMSLLSKERLLARETFVTSCLLSRILSPFTSQKGSTLKGKNVVPRGANSFLLS